jgi:hypothetical protein
VIYVIAFDPIKIMTCWALQNDCHNLSFVKATNVVGEKMVGNTCKMAISYLCHFRFETEFRMNLFIPNYVLFSYLFEHTGCLTVKSAK